MRLGGIAPVDILWISVMGDWRQAGTILAFPPHPLSANILASSDQLCDQPVALPASYHYVYPRYPRRKESSPPLHFPLDTEHGPV